MSNLEAAAAMLAEMDSPAAETTESTAVEASVPGDEAMPEPVNPEKPAGPSPAELRLREAQERIKRLEAKNRERAESKSLANRQAEIERLQAHARRAAEEAESKRSSWSKATKDPIAAFRELGINPAEAYEAITQAMLANDTHEGRAKTEQEKLLAQLKKEFEPKLSEADRLKEEISRITEHLRMRDEREVQMVQRNAEREFLSVVRQGGFEELVDHFEESELIAAGNDIANEMIKSGKPFGIKDVAEEIKSRLVGQLRRAEERRNKRLSSTQSTTAQAAPETSKGNGAKDQKPKTVSNQMAAASASSTSKRVSDDERRRIAIMQLETLDRAGKL